MTFTRSRWWLAAAVTAVIAVCAAVGLVVVLVRGPATPHASAPTRTPTPTPTVSTRTTPAPTPTPTPTRTPIPAHLAANTVSIPSQHVSAPVGVCQIVDGGLEPPADVRHTCQWAGGAPLDSAAGTTVITGHVNYVGQGTGALGHVDRLHAGDTVVTAGPSGVATTWRVISVVHRPKTKGIDAAAFVGRAGARQLYLISCGGAFDAADRSYVDNIYVRAVPAASR